MSSNLAVVIELSDQERLQLEIVDAMADERAGARAAITDRAAGG
jgi:hypothetical protein